MLKTSFTSFGKHLPELHKNFDPKTRIRFEIQKTSFKILL
jgi:hypothetical protein